MNSSDPYRKVALVLSGLDADASDALIDQMPTHQARRVRAALVDLEEIDPEEQAAAVQEFLRGGQQQAPGLDEDDGDGVKLDPGLAARLRSTAPDDGDTPTLPPATSSPREAAPALPGALSPSFAPHNPPGLGAASPAAPLPATESTAAAPPEGPLFDFLENLSGEELAAHLEQERPLTVAVVLTHLSPTRAADVVARLPAAIQSGVLRRVADLRPTDLPIIREVERGLRARIRQAAESPPPTPRGIAAITSILQAAQPESRQRILDGLSTHAPDLAVQVAPPQAELRAVSFADLEELPDVALARIVEASRRDVLVVALAGAHPSFCRRVLEQLPAAEAKLLRKRVDVLGPLRLTDVEHAQQALVDVARRLHALGRINLTRERSLSLTI